MRLSFSDLFIYSVCLLSYHLCIGQAPQKFSYQSIIRDQNNVLIANTSVGVKLSIVHGSEDGQSVYTEIHSTITNINGLISLILGQGEVESGVFADIDWSEGPYFILTEVDPNGANNYTISGTTPMMSVPYALYAASSGSSSGLPPGGTVGQILVKASSENQDAQWITPGNLFFTGMIMEYPYTTAPEGWLFLKGGTIGSASSGATVLAGNGAYALFQLLWNEYENTLLPIQDNAGNPVERGPSAVSDWNAGKRMPLFNRDALFVRGEGTQSINGRQKSGGLRGSIQEDQMQRVTGSFDIRRFSGGNAMVANNVGAISIGTGSGTIGNTGTSSTNDSVRQRITFNSANSPTSRVSATTDGETRVSSIATRWIIKL
jgi:hypothetical protein